MPLWHLWYTSHKKVFKHRYSYDRFGGSIFCIFLGQKTPEIY